MSYYYDLSFVSTVFSFFQFRFHTAQKLPCVLHPQIPVGSMSQGKTHLISDYESRPNKEREKSPIQKKNEFLPHLFLFFFLVHLFIRFVLFFSIITILSPFFHFLRFCLFLFRSFLSLSPYNQRRELNSNIKQRIKFITLVFNKLEEYPARCYGTLK